MKKYNVLLFALIYSTTFHCSLAQNAKSSIDEAISLFNEGRHGEAQLILKKKLKDDPEDTDSRSVLGKMNYHLGEWKAAISIWKEGLNGKESDYMFHLNIGDVFCEKAQQNAPSIYTSQYSEDEISQNPALVEEEFLKNTSESFLEYWKNGIDAYLAAYKMFPYEISTLERLANAYEMNRDFENAYTYWQQIAELYPENSYYLTQAAIYQNKTQTYTDKEKDSLQDLVIKKLYTSLELDDKNPETYKALAIVLKEQKKSNQKELSKKADFYAAFPKFARFEYSEQKANLTDLLLQRDLRKGSKTLKQLVDSLSKEVAEFEVRTSNEKESFIENQNILAMLLAADMSDSKLPRNFSSSFAIRPNRKKIMNVLSGNQYGQWLLIQLMRETREIRLIREAGNLLVKEKVPNMHDVLAGILEYDYLDESMQVAQNMVLTNDTRSKAALLKELRIKLPKSSFKKPNGSYYAIQTRQMRAILALSRLKTDRDVQNELLMGLERQEVRLFCAVALYSQTKNLQYLKLAKKFKPKKAFYPELGRFLKQFEEPKARALAAKLMKR